MKKQALISILILFLTGSTVWANDLRIGIEAGPTFTNFVGQQGQSNSSLGLTWNGYQINPGFTGGLFADYFFNENFSVEPEVAYVRKGSNPQSQLSGITNNSYYTLDYIEFYVFPKFHFSLGALTANVFAGPSLGILSSGQVHLYTSDGSIDVTKDITNNLNSTDYGLNFGAGIELGHFLVNIKYQLGLEDVQKSNLTGGIMSVQNQMLNLNLGYFL